MSTQPHNDDALDLQEFAAEEGVLKLEEEVQQMAEKILEYRTTLPGQLSSTLSSLLACQRPVLPTRLLNEGPGLDSIAGFSKGLEGSIELKHRQAEKIQLLNQKILSNALMFRIVLRRMEEYIGRMDKLASSDGIIHPAFKRKCTS
ncbi:hypothetical protein CDL12_04443 [Handroanthus impetiginosus]|uniref:Uncharacterized protein n=1 Tax=Handroanthus impetiginosus TaxID=429701 RepID=A0A2G9HZB0_9LAMI|nr:hypothetical protein CDL12_04443 [Handroanthus impetiginosus]